jgi:hypothetical protein
MFGYSEKHLPQLVVSKDTNVSESTMDPIDAGVDKLYFSSGSLDGSFFLRCRLEIKISLY